MANPYFQFKQFTIYHDQCGMKVTTDACLFGAWCGQSEAKRILDIGSGTGLLSLMLAQRFPECAIDAVEIDQEAFQQAKSNVDGSPWKERIKLFNQAIQAYNPTHLYDLIITNPPFFPEHLKSSDLQKNKALHSDVLPFSDLLKSVKYLLKPTGSLQVLLPPRQFEDFKKMATFLGLHSVKEIKVFNKPDKALFRIMAELSFQKTTTIHEEIFITDISGEYTPQFKVLLKDYYLKL